MAKIRIKKFTKNLKRREKETTKHFYSYIYAFIEFITT